MRAFLVRVGVDQAYGKWNAPVDLASGQFLFVPIPDGESKIYSPGNARPFTEIVRPLRSFSRTYGVAKPDCPPMLLEQNMHLDPDFEHLTYGDNGSRRGRGIATLGANDLLVFYAGLRSIAPPQRLVYALIGLFVVSEVVRAVDVPKRLHRHNAHTRWSTISENDIVVRGQPRVSGLFDRCLVIGGWREGAYRVDPQIEQAWGGLSVKNGFIQRSVVPPEFKSARQFQSWLRLQQVGLLQRNY